MKRTIFGLALAATMAGSVLTLTPVAASAGVATLKIIQSEAVRSAPNRGSAPTGHGNAGQFFDVDCYTSGEYVPDPRGDGNFTWYRGKVRDGASGYMSMSHLEFESGQRISNC